MRVESAPPCRDTGTNNLDMLLSYKNRAHCTRCVPHCCKHNGDDCEPGMARKSLPVTGWEACKAGRLSLRLSSRGLDTGQKTSLVKKDKRYVLGWSSKSPVSSPCTWKSTDAPTMHARLQRLLPDTTVATEPQPVRPQQLGSHMARSTATSLMPRAPCMCCKKAGSKCSQAPRIASSVPYYHTQPCQADTHK